MPQSGTPGTCQGAWDKSPYCLPLKLFLFSYSFDGMLNFSNDEVDF